MGLCKKKNLWGCDLTCGKCKVEAPVRAATQAKKAAAAVVEVKAEVAAAGGGGTAVVAEVAQPWLSVGPYTSRSPTHG